MTLYWMDRQVSKELMAMISREVSIKELLDELEESGINIAELRKLHERGQQADALKESLIKLYQAHKFTAWFCGPR